MAQLEKLGKYEVLGQIAAGGFGVVYKARDPYIKRLVAIKTCPADNEDLRNRFFREAEIVGNLKHPNITIVHDFGVEGDVAFLVQEYLSGEDLLAKIRDKRAMSLDDKLEILLQVAQGLGHAHSQGVIHRDVKPGNIRVLEDGRVKIMDFGIAKLVTARTQLTQKGMTVGTVGYLAPEQVSDGEVTQRTDVFGFGVLAYEFLTYHRPFSGRTLGELIPRIMKDEPPAVSHWVEDSPPALDDLIRRCLAKNPADRYPSFEPIVADLGGILSEGQLAAVLPSEVVERTTRLELVPPPAPTPPRVEVPTQTAVRTEAAPPPSAPPRPTFEDTRPVILVSELQAAAEESAESQEVPSGSSSPTDRTRRYGTTAAPTSAPAPLRDEVTSAEASLPSAPPATETRPEPVAARPARPESLEPPPMPDPDMSLSGFAPPPLPPPPDAAGDAPTRLQASFPVAPVAHEEPHSPMAAPPAATESGAGSGLGKLLLLLGAAAVAFVVLGVVVWMLFGRGSSAPEPTAVAPVPVAVPVTTPQPAVAATGTLVVVAEPWGVVESIVDQSGEQPPGVTLGPTPLALAAAPGRWTVTVSHPALPAPVTCEVEVVAGSSAECRVVTSAVDVNTYFREAGWWR